MTQHNQTTPRDVATQRALKVAPPAEPEVERLREDCAEAYQAVGFLADCLGYWQMAEDNPRAVQITKLLDNLSAAAEGEPRTHADILPFGWQA